MNPTIITSYIITICGCAMLIYNLIMEMNKAPNDTIGAICTRAAANNIFLPFLMGLVAGHLFWN